MTPPRNCRKTLVGASIARPCPFALQENRPGKCVAAVSGRATNGRPYTRNKAGMQFFDGLRSGQDRSLQISRQRCGGYNKVGGNKKSHHGRWWENIIQTSIRQLCSPIDFLGHVSRWNSNFVRALYVILTIAVDTAIGAIPQRKGLNLANLAFRLAHGDSNGPVLAINFGQFLDAIHVLGQVILRGGSGNLGLAISLAQNALGSHGDLASLRNNLFLVGLVNVTSQRRDKQSGQDGQDDQDDDQLDEGEALFVFQFFEYLVFLQLFVFVPTLQDLIGISYRNFTTQFVFCQLYLGQ